MTFSGNIKDLQAAEVVDSTGDKVGKVGQVYLTNDTQEPSWVTVNTGLFGTKETFIPLADARYSDGAITVPYEKSFIKDAPHVDEDGEISREEEDELYRYYGVQDGAAGTGQTDRGQADRDHTGRDAAIAGGAGAGAGAGLRGDEDRAGKHAERGERDYDKADVNRERAAEHGGLRGDVDNARADVDERRGDRQFDKADRDLDNAEGVTLHEERVNVGTQRQETGKARLRKYVVTDTEQVEVPVKREEVVLERQPADGRTGGHIGEEEATVTLSEERPVVEKETVATEQVNLGKRTAEDTERVDTQVAHEEVDVEGVDGRGVDGRGVDGRDANGRGI